MEEALSEHLSALVIKGMTTILEEISVNTVQEEIQHYRCTEGNRIKGTVALDFRPLVFSTNRPHIVPKLTA
jgi:hypothetical protein